MVFRTVEKVTLLLGLFFSHVDSFMVSSPSVGKQQSMSLRMSTTEEPLSLDPKETALVLIEYQNEFTTEGGKLHDAVKDVMETTGMLQKSKSIMDRMRYAGCKIVHVPISFDLVCSYS